MTNKDNRILWLINHTTLREFEVPLLVSLGFEVYVPKLFPEDEANRSASVDYTFDNTLTLPKEKLEILNTHDFYADVITPQVADIINSYFNTAFFAFFPTLLKELVKNFRGRLLLRVFGLAGTASYNEIIKEILSKNFLQSLRAIEHRFWFAQAYSNLYEVESDVLRRKAITLPLGLPKNLLLHENSWTGSEPTLLFVCPRIFSSPSYYGAIYKSFKKTFGDLPHIIAGAQPLPVDDPAVKGFQTREQLNEWLKVCKVMFYHSQEPRHLHYHPLEAITFGMPLIYMRGGILEQLGGIYQPGACNTLCEARKKIKQVLNDDRKFIQELLTHQQKIMEHFQFSTCRKIWEKNFSAEVMSKKPQTNRALTIAIFLPIKYRGGSLRAAKNIAKMLVLGSSAANEEIRVIFSCVSGYYDLKNDFSDLMELGITIRETNWSSITRKELENTSMFISSSFNVSGKKYLLPKDGMGNFHDCDFWLLVSDRTDPPIAPIKPYGVMVYDYIQRYVPELFENFIEKSFLDTARNARFVGVTTPQTRTDAIQYAGVHADRTELFPMEFTPLESSSHVPTPKNYFIWPTNLSVHKNHIRSLEALEIFYQKYNGKFVCLMTGVGTDLFINDKQKTNGKYQRKLYSYIVNSELLKDKLKISGYLTDEEYVYILSKAKFLWHPALIDNGTFSVIEAAYCGVPSLSSDYPQMCYINERFNLNMLLTNARNSQTMAKDLFIMETKHTERKQLLPEKDELAQFSYLNQAPEFWGKIKKWL